MISFKLGIEYIEWFELFSLYEKVGMFKQFIENKEFDKIACLTGRK